ncbi:hypothetical protein [Microcoleus sp. D3_18a_C4]|uniref:hypothetical protein n=1 Tax=Microcoleus sp. D3_18a_C4 TaxID=3055332 RepID=UPI002FD45E28
MEKFVYSCDRPQFWLSSAIEQIDLSYQQPFMRVMPDACRFVRSTLLCRIERLV